MKFLVLALVSILSISAHAKIVDRDLCEKDSILADVRKQLKEGKSKLAKEVVNQAQLSDVSVLGGDFDTDLQIVRYQYGGGEDTGNIEFSGDYTYLVFVNIDRQGDYQYSEKVVVSVRCSVEQKHSEDYKKIQPATGDLKYIVINKGKMDELLGLGL